MTDSQDKLTPSGAVKLAELKKQLAKEKTVSASALKEQIAVPANKSADKQQTKPASTSVKSTHDKNNKSTGSSGPSNTDTESESKTSILWFFSIINAVLLAAIIGSGYWAWLAWQTQNQQQTDALAAQQTRMTQQQNNIAQSIASNQLVKSDLEQQNQALQTSIQSLIEQFQLTSAQVQTNQRNLADVSGRRPADWLLAEADYLVRMAGRKLWLEHDVKTAIMMLQSADGRIQDLDDPSLLPIRAKLAEDLQSLQQVNQVSTSSIALTLGAMLKQIDNLPFAFFNKPEVEVVDETVTGSIDDWRLNLARNWREATQHFFSFKKISTEIKPFMSQQQQWLSKEQLKFALLQAQAAVMQENATLYQQSLQTAFGLLIASFDTEKDKVVQFTQSLNHLQLTDFTRTYPEQFTVAPLLRDIIEQRLSSRFVNGNN